MVKRLLVERITLGGRGGREEETKQIELLLLLLPYSVCDVRGGFVL